MTYLQVIGAAALIAAALWQEVEHCLTARRSARIAARVNYYCAIGARRDH